MQRDVFYQQGGLRRFDRRLVWSAVLLVAGLTGCGGNSPSGNDASEERYRAARPADQVQFSEIVSSSQRKARDAKNDMQLGGIKGERDRLICNSVAGITGDWWANPDPMTALERMGKPIFSATNWVGKVKTLDATSDGFGVLVIEVEDGVTVGTTNNAISDVSSETLIRQTSPLFSQVSTLSEGQWVMFSGSFLTGTSGDCFSEMSMSLAGKVRSPEFVFRFSEVSPMPSPAAADSGSEPASSIIPGSYEKPEIDGVEGATIAVEETESGYSIDLHDPELNATGGVSGCMIAAETSQSPISDGTFVARGRGDTSESCTLTLSNVSEGSIEVRTSNCEESCTSELGLSRLSGLYLRKSLGASSIDEELVGAAQEPAESPVMIEVSPGAGSVTIVKVVGRMDQVVVHDVIANRGNCPVWIGGIQALSGNLQPAKAMNQQLAFGETADFYINNVQCRLLEVEVNTDAGAWTFAIQ